jgi:hypothetical protein
MRGAKSVLWLTFLPSGWAILAQEIPWREGEESMPTKTHRADRPGLLKKLPKSCQNSVLSRSSVDAADLDRSR